MEIRKYLLLEHTCRYVFSTICTDLQLNKSLTSLWRFKKFPISSGIAPAVQSRDNVHQDSILARRKEISWGFGVPNTTWLNFKKKSHHTLVHFKWLKIKIAMLQKLFASFIAINFSLSITHANRKQENISYVQHPIDSVWNCPVSSQPVLEVYLDVSSDTYKGSLAYMIPSYQHGASSNCKFSGVSVRKL